MKRHTLLILLNMLAVMGCTFAQTPADEWFDQANTAYNSGNYKEAVELYEKILETDMESVPVYYNMGNAYYKMREFPMAIYYYEKALKLDPSNEDAQTNLKIANLSIVDKIDSVPQSLVERWWHSLRSMCTSDCWAWCSVVVFALLLICLFLFLRSRSVGWRKFGFFMGAVFFIAIAFSVAFAAQLRHAANIHDQAIIITPTVTVKSSPSEASVDLFVLHEGSKVTILKSSNGWNQIRIANGSVGWLEEKIMLPF